MRTLRVWRYALSFCAFAALLAGCGTSQPPIGTPVRGSPALTDTSSYQVLHRFGGVNGSRDRGGIEPQGLLDVGGTLYGTTAYTRDCHHTSCGYGTVFSMSASGAKKVLYRFRGGVSDGAFPNPGLIDVNGTLYGTTSQGGSSGCDNAGCGTVYSISPSRSEKVLYGFKGPPDGEAPMSALVDVNGTLYGTTWFGGSSTKCNMSSYHDLIGCGTVYSIDTSGSETVLYSFAGYPDGALPLTPLIDVNGTLYGVTQDGGVTHGCPYPYVGCGTVFSVSPSGSEKVLHRFTYGSGAWSPSSGLLNVDRVLYGATGGFSNRGAIYRINTAGKFQILHRFQGGSDGANPEAPLIEVNGALYGTTVSGGDAACYNDSSGCGTVFSLTPSGTKTVLHAFAGDPDGAFPSQNAALIGVKGRLYGATRGGGKDGRGCACGTVFALSP